MKRTVLVIVVVLVAAACSSGSDDTTTTTTIATQTTTTQSAPAETTTSATEAPAETTTTLVEASGDLASCVIGVWDLDSEAFLALVTETFEDEGGEFGEFQFGDGTYRLTVAADGIFIDERIDWTLLVTSDVGDLAITINDRNEGTWTLEGDVLSTTIQPGEPPEIAILVDGVPFEFPGGASPIDPPSAEFTGAQVTCDANAMTATFEGVTSMWTRSG